MARRGCLLVVAAVVVVPLAELAVGLAVAHRCGGALVVGWLALAVVAGGLVLRRLGPAARQRLRGAWEAGSPPEVALVETVLVYLAGALLVLPGLLSDLLAVLLLLPGVRPWLARRVIARLGRWQEHRRRVRTAGTRRARSSAAAGEVIEVEAREVKGPE